MDDSLLEKELQNDQKLVKGNRIARVIMEYRFDGGGDMQRGNFTSTKAAPTFKRTFAFPTQCQGSSYQSNACLSTI